MEDQVQCSVFKSCADGVPITRTIKRGEMSRFTMQERFLTLLAFDNLIMSSRLAFSIVLNCFLTTELFLFFVGFFFF